MTCKLCGQEKEIQDSHIFPKFVFRWLKEEGGNYIRKPDNPNIRHQDGLKEKMLCKDCEQLFSKYENIFSREIFYPHVHNNKTKFEYNENLYKFSISILWRVLLTGLDSYKKHNTNYINEINYAEKEWRDYLENNTIIKKHSKIYIFFTTHRINYDIQPVERFLYYYARGVDGDIAFYDNSCFIYAKLARVIILGEIKNPESHKLSNTVININGGTFETTGLKLNNIIKDYLINRVIQINENYDKVSEKQKNIANEHTIKLMKECRGEEMLNIINAQSIMRINPNFRDF